MTEIVSQQEKGGLIRYWKIIEEKEASAFFNQAYI